MTPGELLRAIRLAFGDLGGWWPAEGPFEVAVGALLVQAVAWRNASLAVAALKGRGLLVPRALAEASPAAVSEAIRPALFHLQKTRYLQAFASFVHERLSGDIEALRDFPASEQEALLLALPGVGRETAAAIMVYALGEAVAVVDAYAMRVLRRTGLIGGGAPAGAARAVMAGLIGDDADTARLVHAGIVELGRNHCRRVPLCPSCPVDSLCPKILGHPAQGRGDRPARNAGTRPARREAGDRGGSRRATSQGSGGARSGPLG